MTTIPLSPFDFESRVEKTRVYLEASGLDAVILLNTRNIFWLSGSAQASHLIIFKNQDPVLLVRRNIDLARKHSWFPADWIKSLGSTKDTIATVTGALNGGSGKIGMELNGLPASYYLNFVKGLGSDIAIENVSEPLRNLRMIKDSGEIDKIEQAALCAEKTQDVVYHMTMEEFLTGTTERDIAAEMVHIAKQNRSEHYSIYDNNMFTNFNNFFIVTSGEALWTPSTFPIMSGAGFSPAIPYGPSDRVLEEGDMLVCDYAVLVDGYHADHARSYVINGVFPELYKERYSNLKLAYERALDFLKAGTTTGEFFKLMASELDRIEDPDPEIRMSTYFEGNGQYYQGLGHGIGLELDEPPFILKDNDISFESGMVISVEPKIMVPGWGAINFEDNFVISENEHRRLTNTRFLEW